VHVRGQLHFAWLTVSAGLTSRRVRPVSAQLRLQLAMSESCQRLMARERTGPSLGVTSCAPANKLR
jgi:hypothetical protein